MGTGDEAAPELERLLATPLPEGCLALRDAIGELAELRRRASDAGGEPDADQRAHADALLATIRRHGAEWCAEPGRSTDAVDLAPGAEPRRWLAEAVSLWLRFPATRGELLFNSVDPDAFPIPPYPVDLAPRPGDAAKLRAALCRGFGWTAAELAEIEAGTRALTSNLELKHELAALLARRAAQGSPLELMRLFYGAVPFGPGEVDAVITQTGVYFCLSAEARREATASYLARIELRNSPLSDRFPAFGHFERDAVDAELVADLARRLEPRRGRVPVAVVAETLATMVQLVETAKLPYFLVHDSWGHGWQESLCDFEWLYQKSPQLGEALDAAAGPLFGGQDTPALAEAFRAEGGRTRLDEGLLLRTLTADLRGRVLTGANAVLAELLADIADTRLSGTWFEAPTTSLLGRCPVRLDLVLEDLEAYAALWTRPLAELAGDASAAERLATSLRARGRPASGLDGAVAHAQALARERLAAAIGSPRLAPGGDAREPAGPAQRLAVAMTRLACQLIDFEEVACAAPRRAPAEGPPDPATSVNLAVLATAWYFERDRARHVWQLDAIFRDVVRPQLEQLSEALGAS